MERRSKGEEGEGEERGRKGVEKGVVGRSHILVFSSPADFVACVT